MGKIRLKKIDWNVEQLACDETIPSAELNLVEFRKQNLLMAKDVAEYLQVSRSYYSQIEHGIIKMSYEKFLRLMHNNFILDSLLSPLSKETYDRVMYFYDQGVGTRSLSLDDLDKISPGTIQDIDFVHGYELKLFRTVNDLTQNELAAAFGTDQSAISRLEKSQDYLDSAFVDIIKLKGTSGEWNVDNLIPMYYSVDTEEDQKPIDELQTELVELSEKLRKYETEISKIRVELGKLRSENANLKALLNKKNITQERK